MSLQLAVEKTTEDGSAMTNLGDMANNCGGDNDSGAGVGSPSRSRIRRPIYMIGRDLPTSRFNRSSVNRRFPSVFRNTRHSMRRHADMALSEARFHGRETEKHVS